MSLFILKLTVTPILVAVLSLIARRYGATVGGLIMGLPLMTGPVLFFLGLEKGADWLAQAALAAMLAVIGIAAFIFTFGRAAAAGLNPFFSWAAAAAAFALTNAALLNFTWAAWSAGLTAGATLLVMRTLLPPPLSAEGPRPLPWWDLPMRMLATAVMILGLHALAQIATARVTGVMASYPVILTAVGVFTHARWGVDPLLNLLRGISLSLLAFVGFFAVVNLTVHALGIYAAFALAVPTGLATSGALMWWNGRRNARRPQDLSTKPGQ